MNNDFDYEHSCDEQHRNGRCRKEVKDLRLRNYPLGNSREPCASYNFTTTVSVERAFKACSSRRDNARARQDKPAQTISGIERYIRLCNAPAKFERPMSHTQLCLKFMCSPEILKDISGWHQPYGVTLRFKKGTNRDDALSSLVYFLKRLNKKIFNSANTRHGVKLGCISKMEWSWEQVEKEQANRDPHIHMVIESPEHLSEEEFKLLVKEQWEDTKSGKTKLFHNRNKNNPDKPSAWKVFKIICMEKMYSKRWVRYISKIRTTLSADDVLFEAWVTDSYRRR